MDKWTRTQYEEFLDRKKQQAQQNGQLYIIVNARELQDECEPGGKNLAAVCKAMLARMLEGDSFEVEPKMPSKVAGKLSVRYYVDNLDPTRRTLAQVKEEQKQAARS